LALITLPMGGAARASERGQTPSQATIPTFVVRIVADLLTFVRRRITHAVLFGARPVMRPRSVRT
jgi:hypothetical protein